MPVSDLVSLVVTNAQRLPIIGNPIYQTMTATTATMHHLLHQPTDNFSFAAPPPPYEKEEATHGKAVQKTTLSWLTGHVLKRASLSSSGCPEKPIDQTAVSDTNATATKIRKENIEEGIALVKMATDIYNSSIATSAVNDSDQSYRMSIQLYMMGLDKILSSLPIDSNSLLKSSLEAKLNEMKERHDLVLHAAEDEEKMKRQLTEEEREQALNGLSSLIIQAAVLTAIALKRSPIPGLMNKLLGLTKYAIIKVDETCSVRERAFNLANFGLVKALEIDQHYKIHQFFAEVFYTSCTAVLKAGIAYAEESISSDSQESSSIDSGGSAL